MRKNTPPAKAPNAVSDSGFAVRHSGAIMAPGCLAFSLSRQATRRTNAGPTGCILAILCNVSDYGLVKAPINDKHSESQTLLYL